MCSFGSWALPGRETRVNVLRLGPKVRMRMRMEEPPSLSPRHAGRLRAGERAAAVRSRTCAAPGRPASVPAPRPRSARPKPLTCSRVARECTAPGAAWAPELAALAQLFLLVLPPPALSHRRGAEARPRDRGLASPRLHPLGAGRRPRRSSGGSGCAGGCGLGGLCGLHLQPAGGSPAQAEPVSPPPPRGAVASFSCFLSPTPSSFPFSLPRPAPRTWSRGSGGFWSGLASSGRGFGVPHSHTRRNRPLDQNKPVQNKQTG